MDPKTHLYPCFYTLYQVPITTYPSHTIQCIRSRLLRTPATVPPHHTQAQGHTQGLVPRFRVGLRYRPTPVCTPRHNHKERNCPSRRPTLASTAGSIKCWESKSENFYHSKREFKRRTLARRSSGVGPEGDPSLSPPADPFATDASSDPAASSSTSISSDAFALSSSSSSTS